MFPNFIDKLTAFCDRLEKEMNADTARRHAILQENALKDGRRGYHEINADLGGKRFVRVYEWNGSQNSVRYFVEKDTGTIFGAAGWKKYNPVHEYGTLDTIDEWDWSGYYATHKNGKSSLVPANLRR